MAKKRKSKVPGEPEVRHHKRKHETTEEEGEAYQRNKAAAARRSRELAWAGRDLRAIPAVENQQRKDRCRHDLRAFCETYFPAAFRLRWSKDHLKVIDKLQVATLSGGLFAVAMPRGSGKTTLTIATCVWALLYGHHPFVCLIGSDEKHASDMLESIKMQFETNAKLLEDFPEVVYPIVRLEGSAHKCKGQHIGGKRTHITWAAKEVVLPTVEGSPASGSVIRVAGITGKIRGMMYTRADNSQIRPTLVVLDDPQTDESARSHAQCESRRRVIYHAVLGLAGPGKKISAVMPCTVIRDGDLADKLLDRDESPEWNGERTKMLYSFPTNKALWQKYQEIRSESLKLTGGIEEATAFYVQNRDEMDEGAVAAWPERYNPDEASAVQHAMNLLYRDEAAFWAEYQNEPKLEELVADQLTEEQIRNRANRRPRFNYPESCEKLTAFVDVQGKLLYYAVCAFEVASFTGYVIDYGAWPEQGREYFTLNDCRKTLQRKYPNTGQEGAIRAGLDGLAEKLLAQVWSRDDDTDLRIDRLLVDAGWELSREVVYQFAKESPYAAQITPSRGRGVTASAKPFAEYRTRPGDRVGHNWRMPAREGRRVRHVLYDTNYWKSFVMARLATARGDYGALTLFGDAREHELFAQHLTAEYSVRTEGRERRVDEWKHRPERFDNHWLDCVVGCCVAASMEGVALMGESKPRRKKKRGKVSWAEAQQRARRGR